MTLRIPRLLSGKQGRLFPQLVVLGIAALCFSGVADEPHAPDLTLHEWGTFTAIAGSDGRTVEWIPVRRPVDLSGFVEHLSNANLKLGLRGTIRMETPVLYFYSPRELTVSVKVAFSRGVITEWYPHATRIQPNGPLHNTDLSTLKADGSISWNDIAITPNVSGEFLRDPKANRYYYARETPSSPLRVKTTAGDQQEKFLFYRGASAAQLPLQAEQNSQGKLLVKNLSEDQIPAIFFFERRGERVGYRLVRWVVDETLLDPPELTGDIDSVSSDLEGILADQGLYPDEAHAMVETWRNSWCEQGSRLIYIVPRSFIDSVLPLAINPTPGQMVRTFVGRVEIVTPTTAREVETALASNDEVTLNRYARFLEPILEILRKQHQPATRLKRSSQTPNALSASSCHNCRHATLGEESPQ